MTEAQWLTGTDPAPMMSALNGCVPSDRKARLFACACCRRLEHLMTDRDRAVVAALELCADGVIPHDKIYATAGVPIPATGAYDPPGGNPSVRRVIAEALSASAWGGAVRARAYTVDAVRAEEGDAARAGEWARQSALIRCVFGNPFRRVWFSSEWLTDTVLALAQEMHESGDFSAMPILADALQDAGCENAGILNHCRVLPPAGAEEEQAHARGCWVLDLLLAHGGHHDRLGHAAVTA
jgi:hypothetical protein